jgi:hypothetical protein
LGALLCLALLVVARSSMLQPVTLPKRRTGGLETSGTGAMASRLSVWREWRGEAPLCVLAALAMPLGASQRVILAWDPSVDATVTGYRVYYHATESTNVTVLDVGKTTSCTLTNLCETETYSFSVTAYNEVGLESDPSNTVAYTVPLGRLAPVWTTDEAGRPVMQLVVRGIESKALALQTSTNLVDWATVVTAAPGQNISWSVTNDLGNAALFYRTLCVR